MPKIDEKKEAKTGTVKLGIKKTKRKEKNENEFNGREIIYPKNLELRKQGKLEVIEYSGDSAINVEIAKNLLGWLDEQTFIEQESLIVNDSNDKKKKNKEVSFHDEFDLEDIYGNKVRLTKNLQNRPLDLSTVEKYKQEILTKNWTGPTFNDTCNGETIIIGKTGMTISGQHRLVAEVFAHQEWENGENCEHWKEIWETPPFFESLVVFGVSEEGKVTRTLDNTKPRTLADVTYCDPNFFGNMEHYQREACCRTLDQCMKVLWKRLGPAGRGNFYSGIQTHAESLNFVERHGGPKGKLIELVKYINSLDEGGNISIYCGRGVAVALAWLFASSNSNQIKYLNGSPPSEKQLDMSRLSKAKDYWSELSRACTIEGKNSPVRAVFEVERSYDKSSIFVEKGVLGRGTEYERTAALIKGWGAFLDKTKVHPKDVKLSYELLPGANEGSTSHEDYYLDDEPCIGGIDHKKETRTQVTVEEIEEAKEEIDSEREEKNKKALKDALNRRKNKDVIMEDYVDSDDSEDSVEEKYEDGVDNSSNIAPELSF